MVKIAEVTRSFDVHYPYGVMHVNFENEVPVGLLSGLDCSEPENMIVALERIRNCGNSKVELDVEHNEDVLNENPSLREAAEHGSFKTGINIDTYIESLKKDMEVH